MNLPDDVRSTHTMLSEEELTLLYGLARDAYTGAGEIVDGGAFLGGSAMALACGLRDNPRDIPKRGRVHSYDRFVADHFTGRYLEGYAVGDSTRAYVEGVLEPVAPFVQIHEGDIANHPWPSDREIEILFIDIAKSWDTNDVLLRQFFPRLLPGVSHVIQQDYHWPHTPWISITMELFRDCFSYVGSMPWATAAYRLERPISTAMIPDRLYDLGAERLTTLATDAHRWPRGTREWAAQQANLVSLAQWLGDGATARERYDDMQAAAPSWVQYFNFHPVFEARS